MKIAIVTQSYYPRYGGVTEHVGHTARGLRVLGHEVTIVTSVPLAEKLAPEASVARLGAGIQVPFQGAFVDVTVGWNLRRQVEDLWRRNRFDLVHVHQPLTPTLPLLAVESAPVPVVGTFHAAGGPSRLLSTFRERLLWRWQRLARRIAVSPAARDFVARYFPGPVDVLPNGVDIERFHPDVRPPGELADGRLNVLFVGRLDPRKGLPVLLEAFPEVRRAVPEARLLVVGDSYLRPWFVSRVPRALREHVCFTGSPAPEAMPGFFASAQVVVSPARRNESFGIVLLEAMASGRPVVASDSPGYRNVVEPGVEGRLVPPGDPRALAEALTALLRDEAERTRLGRNGRRKAERFAWPRITAAIERTYCEALGGPAPSASACRPAAASLEPALPRAFAARS